jgi:uncharacterized protein (TIGR00106 family)
MAGSHEVHMILLEFSLIPLDQGPSIGEHVAKSLELVAASGLDYRVGAMGTVLEGEWDEVMGVVRRCVENASRDCERIAVTMKVDYRRGAGPRLAERVAGVEKRLGRKLRT